MTQRQAFRIGVEAAVMCIRPKMLKDYLKTYQIKISSNENLKIAFYRGYKSLVKKYSLFWEEGFPLD